jgi:CheY-like chemotaxis protein
MGRTILVVDDDDGIIEVVRIILEGEGYQVRANMDGNLHHILTDDLPDLILLDVLIAGIDGREICQSLKKHDRTHSIPVIMLSAHSDAHKIAEDSGADGFLEKPFDVDMLIDIVARHLSSTETV